MTMKGTAILKAAPMMGAMLRGAQVFGGEHALDDEEIGGPVAEADDAAEAEDDAGPVDAHGIVVEVAEGAPQVHVAAVWPMLVTICACRLVQPPASIRPRMGISSAPSQMRMNCRTSLKMAERSPPSAT